MLLKVALEKILSETNPAKHTELREACQDALEKLKNDKVNPHFGPKEATPRKKGEAIPPHRNQDDVIKWLPWGCAAGFLVLSEGFFTFPFTFSSFFYFSSYRNRSRKAVERRGRERVCRRGPTWPGV